ncbi:putative bifunctional diguanylate cyclase/phosphodiesterase [Actinoplanes sp. NPDC049681]|uniref:putative bifunctional diguanylate cyclase/phosphodiesterase n=1 Tax=Actinoplanes sp. NPDC049681 TaxID=3363905 RepID=UPI0037B1330E
MRLRPTRVGALTVLLATVCLAGQMVWLAGGVPTLEGHLVTLAALTVLFAVTDKFVVSLPVRRGYHNISLSEIPLVLGLIMVHPALLVAARIAGGLPGLATFRRQRGAKLAFNTCLFATQATVAGVVFHLAAGAADPLGPVGWLAVYGATFASDLVSIVLITAVIALQDDSRRWRDLLRADIRGLLQLPLVAVTTTMGLVTAVVVHDRAPAAGLLAVLAFAVYRVFQRYARQTQGHAQVEALYDFTQAVTGARDATEVTRVALGRVRDLVRVETAELLLLQGDRAVRLRVTGRDRFRRDVVGVAGDHWWRPAASGRPIRGENAMAVPLDLDDVGAVLLVAGRLPEVPPFTSDQLRLLEALARHAGVALRNARLVEMLRHTGLTDALTELPNRRRFVTDLQETLDAARSTTRRVSVLLLALDRFKDINAGLGHDVGDRVLREVGSRLRGELGGQYMVARAGGDGFALLVTHAATPADVLAVAHRVREVLERPVDIDDVAISAQASIGVAYAPDHGHDAERLLQRADVALHAAKDARSGVRIYRPEDDRHTPRRLRLMGALRAAVENGELDVVYQPKISAVTGAVIGVEALSRWEHSDGPVSPDEFIQLAERSGLIGPLTLNVMDKALAECATWRVAGHDISMAINVSPLSLAEPAFADDVEQALQRHGLPAGALTLEITEGAVMQDPARSMVTLHALHRLGVKLSIDDFGTGHSSLARLAELPIHEVKIDKSFVQHLTSDRSKRAVTDAALHLGRALDLVVVAEGVETESDHRYLCENGCDVIQGYFVARPLPAPELTDWLVTRRHAAETAGSAS